MRDLTAEWVGPFGYRQAFRARPRGLYLIMVGHEPLYVGAALDISRALSGHLVIRGPRILPGDMLGRELLDWAKRYKLKLQVKVASVYETAGESKECIHSMEALQDAVSLITCRIILPCNQHGRERYGGRSPLLLHNIGKTHPLKPTYSSILARQLEIDAELEASR